MEGKEEEFKIVLSDEDVGMRVRSVLALCEGMNMHPCEAHIILRHAADHLKKEFNIKVVSEYSIPNPPKPESKADMN